MNIRKANLDDTELLAKIISSSNKDVAKQFGLNFENSPKHPSFCSSEWIKDDYNRGEIYFILDVDDTPVGCIAYEQPDNSTAYLNRLAVLPDFRGKGYGKALVKYHLQYSKELNIKNVSIGIINRHDILKKWYLKLGFKEVGLKEFDHLPFNVCFLSIEL